MRLNDLVPASLKSILRPIYNTIRKIVSHPKDRNTLYKYWQQPWDGDNLPQEYIEGKAKSDFLVEILKRYGTPNAKILEIGCNVGRNLNHLFQAGFQDLEAIEISEKAVELLKQTYPEMASQAKIHNFPVEETIKNFKDCEFDIVFSMAVLQHIHTDSNWVFPEIARITKRYLIVVEDEHCATWKHVPRNYKKVFEPHGLKQMEQTSCKKIEGLGSNFVARVFEKVTQD